MGATYNTGDFGVYADCGECSARNGCTIFDGLIKPISDMLIEKLGIELALADAIKVRDARKEYAVGGMVSYIKALREGTIEEDEEEEDQSDELRNIMKSLLNRLDRRSPEREAAILEEYRTYHETLDGDPRIFIFTN